MYCIGLGNPGSRYENTPHNAGALITTAAAEEMSCADWRKDTTLQAHTTSCGGWQFCIPDTYMNTSGESVRRIADRIEGDPAGGMVIIHDDIDLALGTYKIVAERGHGGHNGIRSIADAVGTSRIPRIKIGIAPVDESGGMRKPSGEGAVTRYVLAPMSNTAREKITDLTPTMVEILNVIAEEGVDKAMSLYN